MSLSLLSNPFIILLSKVKHNWITFLINSMPKQIKFIFIHYNKLLRNSVVFVAKCIPILIIFIRSLFEREITDCCERKTETVLNLRLTLCDEKRQDLVDAFIFTFDENPKSILKFLKLKKVQEMTKEEFKQVEKEYTQFVKEVEENDDRHYQFVLEASKNEEKVLFRIIDTFFI